MRLENAFNDPNDQSSNSKRFTSNTLSLGADYFDFHSTHNAFSIFPEPIKFLSLEIWISGSVPLITFFHSIALALSFFFFNSILLPLSIQNENLYRQLNERQSLWFLQRTFVKSIQPTIILDFRLENTYTYSYKSMNQPGTKSVRFDKSVYAWKKCSHLLGFLREWWLKWNRGNWNNCHILTIFQPTEKKNVETNHIMLRVLYISIDYIHIQSVSHSLVCWLIHADKRMHTHTQKIILLMPKPNETTFRVIYRWAHQIHWFMNMAEKIFWKTIQQQQRTATTPEWREPTNTMI